MNKKVPIILTFAVIFSLVFIGCSSNSHNNNIGDTESTSNQTQHISEGNGYSDEYIDVRTSWNIELTFVDCTEEAIVIKICDYDNQGFAFNYLYFELEYLENGNWVKLTKLNENSAMNDLGYVLPSSKTDYVDCDCHNFLSLIPPEVILKSGRYRLTKVLSGRDFSVEFDMNFD